MYTYCDFSGINTDNTSFKSQDIFSEIIDCILVLSSYTQLNSESNVMSSYFVAVTSSVQCYIWKVLYFLLVLNINKLINFIEKVLILIVCSFF